MVVLLDFVMLGFSDLGFGGYVYACSTWCFVLCRGFVWGALVVVVLVYFGFGVYCFACRLCFLVQYDCLGAFATAIRLVCLVHTWLLCS